MAPSNRGGAGAARTRPVRPLRQKLVSLQAAAALCARAKKAGRRPVLCTGSFDLLHAGHIHSLTSARAMGDLLIVALNSDKSYKEYKDGRGPLCGQTERAALLAALECVDYVVLFDEPGPMRVIRAIKPSVYANGAYYGKDCIEAGAVKEAGARLQLIPIKAGLSTSELTRRIVAREGGPKRPALFLDRDGVLIEDVGYPHQPRHLTLIPRILPTLKAYQKKGYALIVISNQAGVARGYFSEAQVRRFNGLLSAALRARGVRIDAFYYCPHHPEGTVARYAKVCECRKPRTGLIEKARREHGVDMSRSVFIGDKSTDMEAARRAGVKGILFKAPRGAGAAPKKGRMEARGSALRAAQRRG